MSQGIPQDPTSVHTLGTRWTGEEQGFLWDFEPIAQLGLRGSEPIHAGAVTAGLGYSAEKLPMNPTVWAYYDWASGDHSPGTGNYSTFNQLYGFGHYYLGFMDLIGRENIRDWNTQVYLYPAKWLSFNVQYHVLNLDSARDALYNPAGAVSRVSLNGSAGGDVGQELTFIVNFHLGPHSDILTGWSKLAPDGGQADRQFTSPAHRCGTAAAGSGAGARRVQRMESVRISATGCPSQRAGGCQPSARVK